MTTNPVMTSHHWFRAIAAQRDLDELIGECVDTLTAAGVDADMESPELNRLLEKRIDEHSNRDIHDLCVATGIYEAISESFTDEAQKPSLKLVKDA